ncbi:hydrogenase-3, subunit E [Nautilia profundicola AmH]|uniref:Hydrogenase-3, subunit E n=1 Tax=Nautilia profundicola (strain ATCC BAA-1463 / DSM 18972 / AmH) TaxID=598659 RepID=B9L945_NAUPA|nr:NADH-quinone oxidoreductase subunit C [Nautilia profundicola]ACM92333.1 hydrogenase-3, subunit E [Nautilia profundicola AmH]
MRLIARFALDKLENFEIIDVYESKIERQSVDKKNPTVKSLMSKYPSAIWMERKIKDEFGIEFEGAFDTRPLVKHERFPKHIYPLRKDFNKKEIDFTVFTPYKYEEIEGDNVFVVPVGPIHAGIIEPGHFQFSQAGEEILHLEVRHYYKYRGIEKMVEGKKVNEIKKIVERISGNESIAYQIAFMDILSQASEIEIPNSLKQKYFTLLELERIIHHLTDLGFIPNDAGFGAALAFMSKLTEEARRVMAKITGHRFGFGAIKEEVEIDYQELTKFIDYLKKEVEFFEDWINDIASLWDRFNTTGALSRQKAAKYGVVGVTARASGVELDVRNNLFYKNFGYKMQLGKKGEVSDRFRVRIKEVLNSIEMIKNFKTDKKEKLMLNEFKDGEYMSFVESSIGELFMYMKIKDGVVDRFYVRDPSHINWQAFHTTIYKDIIADFPLINKSFDLSYAGNDL